MPKMFVGIDPGKEGAIVAVGSNGRIKETIPTPIIKGKTKKILQGLATKKISKDQYDVASMCEVVRKWDSQATVFCIEKQQTMPGSFSKGGTAEFQTGYGYGLWIGIINAMGCSHMIFRPADWQSHMLAGTSGKDTKERSVNAALSIWVGHKFFKTPRSRKPHHGITDAALIAEYGRIRSRSTFGE